MIASDRSSSRRTRKSQRAPDGDNSQENKSSSHRSKRPDAPASPAPSRPTAGSAAGRYDVLERSGEGTLFVVYRVRSKSSHAICALKALKGVYSRHQRFAPSIMEAATATSGLRHPHLASLFEAGREEDTVFLVEEWMPSGTLEKRLRRAPMSMAETTSLATSLLDVLIALHESGIFHGDVRPRQILFDAEGVLKLNDLGFSSAYASAGMTLTDVQLEAVHYQSPERGLGAPASARADLYALGVVLYRAISGRVPFDGASPLAIAMRHRNDLPLRPSQFNPSCAPELESFILRLLEKEPTARFSSARDALIALAPAQRPTPARRVNIDAPPEPAPDVRPAGSTPGASPLPSSPSISSTPDADIDSDTPSTPDALQRRRMSRPSRLSPTDLETDSIAGAADAASAPGVLQAARPARRAANNRISAPLAKPLNADLPVADAGIDLKTDSQNDAHDDSHDASFSPPLKAEKKKHRRREMLGAFLALFWTLAAAGLLVGICYGAYVFWMKEAPPPVQVPKYIGLNQSDAQSLLGNRGLQMRVKKEVYNPKKPEGTILEGDPFPGKMVRKGRLILVTVSRGEEPVRMVDFSELSLEQARVIIARHGMRLGQVAEQFHGRVPKGYICGQYPEPGESFRRSEPINLVMSRGPQPSSIAPDPSALPVAPAATRLPDTTPEDEKPSTTALAPQSEDTLISRGAVVSVALPAGGGPQEVKIVVRDSEGEYIAYQQTHEAGDVVDKPIQVVRAQGATALVRVYIGGRLLREIRV